MFQPEVNASSYQIRRRYFRLQKFIRLIRLCIAMRYLVIFMHLSMLCRRGGRRGKGKGFDILGKFNVKFPTPGIYLLVKLLLPRDKKRLETLFEKVHKFGAKQYKTVFRAMHLLATKKKFHFSAPFFVNWCQKAEQTTDSTRGCFSSLLLSEPASSC